MAWALLIIFNYHVTSTSDTLASAPMQASAASVSTHIRNEQAVTRSRSLPLSRLAGTAKRQTGSQSQGLAGIGSTTLLQANLTAPYMPADGHDQCALQIEHYSGGPISYHALVFRCLVKGQCGQAQCCWAVIKTAAVASVFCDRLSELPWCSIVVDCILLAKRKQHCIALSAWSQTVPACPARLICLTLQALQDSVLQLEARASIADCGRAAAQQLLAQVRQQLAEDRKAYEARLAVLTEQIAHQDAVLAGAAKYLGPLESRAHPLSPILSPRVQTPVQVSCL